MTIVSDNNQDYALDGRQAFSKQALKSAANDGFSGRAYTRAGSTILVPALCSCSKMVQAREIISVRELIYKLKKFAHGICRYASPDSLPVLIFRPEAGILVPIYFARGCTALYPFLFTAESLVNREFHRHDLGSGSIFQK